MTNLIHLGDEIIMERHEKVEGNRLIIGEKEYSKIILPRHDMFFENAEKLLDKFKKNGGIVTTAESLSENILTLDYCDYYFDGKLEEENGYMLNAMYRD